MRATTNVVRLGAAAATVLFLSPVMVHAQEPVKPAPATPDAHVCTATLEPGALKVQAEPLQLKANLSQAIGSGVTATIQEEGSGVQVALAAVEGTPAVQAKPSGPSADKPAADKTAADKPAADKPAADKPAAPEPAAAPPAPAAPSSAAAQPAPAAGAVAQSVPLTVNTSAANPGEWTLALQGESGSCTAKLKVEAAPK